MSEHSVLSNTELNSNKYESCSFAEIQERAEQQSWLLMQLWVNPCDTLGDFQVD